MMIGFPLSRPGGPPPSGGANVGTPRHHASRCCSPARLPPSKYPGRRCTRGKSFPWLLGLLRYPPGYSHHSKFINIFVLPYISIILLARSKSVTTKRCEIKYKINTTPCGIPNAVDPAKRGVERMRIEPRTLGFRSETKRAWPAIGRIDRIDRAFLFGNARLGPAPARGCSSPHNCGPRRWAGA
jgi:hypothetical protein